MRREPPDRAPTRARGSIGRRSIEPRTLERMSRSSTRIVSLRRVVRWVIARGALAVAAGAITSGSLALASTTGCRLRTEQAPVAEQALAPDFELPSHEDRTVSLTELLARGPAVLVFYRGHW
jgi:hypothetical protein